MSKHFTNQSKYLFILELRLSKAELKQVPVERLKIKTNIQLNLVHIETNLNNKGDVLFHLSLRPTKKNAEIKVNEG